MPNQNPPQQGGGEGARTEMTAIRLSLPQVATIIAVIFSIWFFLEDRYAPRKSVDADLDAVKRTVVSFVSGQTKFNREVMDQLKTQQIQMSQLLTQMQAGTGGDRGKTAVVPPPSSISGASTASVVIPDLILPERLFTDSNGKAILDVLPSSHMEGPGSR